MVWLCGRVILSHGVLVTDSSRSHANATPFLVAPPALLFVLGAIRGLVWLVWWFVSAPVSVSSSSPVADMGDPLGESPLWVPSSRIEGIVWGGGGGGGKRVRGM